MADLIGKLVIDCRGRLVSENEGRAVNKGPSDRRPLALSTRKVARPARKERTEGKSFNEDREALAIESFSGEMASRQDVLTDREGRDKPAGLKNIPHVLPADLKETAFVPPVKAGEKAAATQIDLKHFRRIRAENQSKSIQERTLAASTGAENRKQFRRPHRKLSDPDRKAFRNATPAEDRLADL
jgi:hypothetical protein